MISRSLPVWASVPYTTSEVGPIARQLFGWMISLLTGMFRHEPDPLRTIGCMLCDWPSMPDMVTAATTPTRARARFTLAGIVSNTYSAKRALFRPGYRRPVGPKRAERTFMELRIAVLGGPV